MTSTSMPVVEAVNLADVTSASVLRDKSMPAHRQGRASTGLYPEISRGKLAELTGRHISTITGYLKGRTRMPLSTATIVATAIGVSVAQLNQDLQHQQQSFAGQRKKRRRAGQQ